MCHYFLNVVYFLLIFSLSVVPFSNELALHFFMYELSVRPFSHSGNPLKRLVFRKCKVHGRQSRNKRANMFEQRRYDCGKNFKEVLHIFCSFRIIQIYEVYWRKFRFTYSTVTYYLLVLSTHIHIIIFLFLTLILTEFSSYKLASKNFGNILIIKKLSRSILSFPLALIFI